MSQKCIIQFVKGTSEVKGLEIEERNELHSSQCAVDQNRENPILVDRIRNKYQIIKYVLTYKIWCEL